MLNLEHLQKIARGSQYDVDALIDIAFNIVGHAGLPAEYYRFAVQVADRALKRSPNNINAVFTRGRAKMMLANYSGAIQDFNYTIQQRPQLPFGWLRRGQARYQQGDYKNAAIDFGEAIACDPECYDAYLMRGYAIMNLGGYDEAITDLNVLIERKQEKIWVEALYYRGNCHYNKQRIAEALTDYLDALKEQFIQPVLFCQMALCYLQQQNYTAALDSYNAALELAPNNEDILHNRETVLNIIADLEAQAKK